MSCVCNKTAARALVHFRNCLFRLDTLTCAHDSISRNKKLQKQQRFCSFNPTPSTDLSTRTVENLRRDLLTRDDIARRARYAAATTVRLPAGARLHVTADPGMRVRVPFGRQRLVGVVHSLATTSELPQEKLKPLLEVIDAEPVIDAQVHGAAGVGRAVLPPSARRGGAPQRCPRLAREGAPAQRAHRTLVRQRRGHRGAGVH